MSEYGSVRVSKLVLKGEKRKKSKKHKKQSTPHVRKVETDEDALRHGNWWSTKTTADIVGNVAIEFGNFCYLRALDNGVFTLGPPHKDGEGPDQEEIFTAFQINANKITLKSGYGKYIKVEKDGSVTGRSDAVGSMELWEPVFQNGKTALLAETGCFMAIDAEDNTCVALRKKVTDHELCTIRSNAEQEVVEETVKEETGDLVEVEKNYVKKFQKFQDRKLKICKGGIKELAEAKESGLLHEVLLDRRSKMKSDRYCK